MPRLLNPLVYDLLDVAQALSETKGRANLRKAALRRSMSTAYYAVFHALCFVCASELVGWSRSLDLEPIYRSVEHGLARARLTGSKASQPEAAILKVGAAFNTLQDLRHASDYASAGLRHVSRKGSEAAIALAREAITGIERMDKGQRRRLAVLLIAKRVDVSLVLP